MDSELDLFDKKTEEILIKNIEELDKLTELKIEIDNTLEEALNDMNTLKEEYSAEQTESLIDLCKDNVIHTIVGQFGIASLFLEAQDGGNVTTTHNFENGITSSEADRQKYNAMQENKQKDFKEIRKSAGYDEKIHKMHREDAKKGRVAVVDEYTGKTISSNRADIDHVVSANEVEFNVKNNLFLSQDERVKMATDDSNLAYTKDSINRSKGKKTMEQFLDKERPEGITNEEAFGIDRNRAMGKDKAARQKMAKTVNKAAFKKYSSELLISGGKDAAKMAAYSAIGVIIHDFALAIVEELKYMFKNKEQSSFKELFFHFKNKMGEVMNELKNKWKEIFTGSLEAGITAFLSNILVFVINLFATTLKKIVSMIRAGFVSLCQAVKIITTRPNGISQDEANFQAAKVLTAGIIGALSLGLSAAIEKFLQSIPGLQPIMMFPIPSFGKEKKTVSDVIAVTLSAVAGGLVSTIVLYFMDKCRSAAKKDKLQIQMVTTSGVVVQCKVSQSWFAINNAYDFFAQMAIEEIKNVEEKFNVIKSSKDENDKSLSELDDIMKAF